MRPMVCAAVVLATGMAGCREGLPTKLGPGQAVDLRGEIAAGVECPMLVVDGRRFSLTGDLGPFKPGDRVCVRGTVAGVSYCMQGEATLSITSIGACP